MKKIIFNAVLFTASMILSIQNIGAQNQISPKEVQQKSIDVTRVTGVESLSTLIIYGKSGEKRVRKTSIISKIYDNGELEKKLIRFLDPADVKGTGFLTYDYKDKDDEKWIYMPALRKTRRIVSSENAKSFMGSEFSYADMSLPTVEDFNYKFLSEKQVHGELCYVLEIIPKDKRIANENGFSQKISYISKKNFLLWKVEYYNLAGEKEKEMTITDAIEVDKKNHKFKYKEMIMSNLKNGRKSVSKIEQIKFNNSIPDDTFTTRSLQKSK